MEKHINDLLEIALKLIEEGKSTIDTAFEDAILLEKTHLINFLKAYSAANASSIGFIGWNGQSVHPMVSHQDATYLKLMSKMSSNAYKKINKRE